MVVLLKGIFYFVVWVFVPAIMVTLAWVLKLRINKVEEKRHRSAMQAGYWAGIMLFIIILIYQVAIFLKTGFPKAETFQGFSLPLALGSALVVFILFLGGKRIVPVVVSGILVLIFNFLIFSALFHYLFIRTNNDVLLSIILGGIFGFLTHFAVAPTTFKEFLRGKSF